MQKMPDRFMIEFHIVVIQSKNIAIRIGVASLGICFFCEERTVGVNFSGNRLCFRGFGKFHYICPANGGLAQLARALAWHARGHEFEPRILHQTRNSRMISCGCFASWYVLWAEFGRFRRKFSRLIPRISFQVFYCRQTVVEGIEADAQRFVFAFIYVHSLSRTVFEVNV